MTSLYCPGESGVRGAAPRCSPAGVSARGSSLGFTMGTPDATQDKATPDRQALLNAQGVQDATQAQTWVVIPLIEAARYASGAVAGRVERQLRAAAIIYMTETGAHAARG